jgi:hypothetical protein
MDFDPPELQEAVAEIPGEGADPVVCAVSGLTKGDDVVAIHK